MRTVGIICPNCSNITQYDSGAESAACKFCKHPIRTKDEVIDAQRKEKVDALRKELDAQLESGFVDYKIVDITNRILGLDVTDGDAWIYKGMASNKVSTKLACYFNCARYMDLNEYDDLFDTMAEDISSSVYMRCEDDWNALDVAYIDVMLRRRRPNDRDEFLMEIIGRLKEIILQCEDAYHAKMAIDGFMKLSIATIAVYCGISEQKAILEKILGYIDDMLSKFKKFEMDERKGYNNRSISDRLKADRKFISRIVSRMGSAAKKIGADEDRKIEYDSFWLSEDIVPFLKPLLDSYDLNEKMFDAGIGETGKLVKAQNDAMDEYIDKYMLKGRERTYKE